MELDLGDLYAIWLKHQSGREGGTESGEWQRDCSQVEAGKEYCSMKEVGVKLAWNCSDDCTSF